MVRVEVRTDKQILKTVNSALAPPATEPVLISCSVKSNIPLEVIRNGCWVDVDESSSGISSAKGHNVRNQLSRL